MTEEKKQPEATITLSRSLFVGVIAGVLALTAGLAGGYFWGKASATTLYEARIDDLETSFDTLAQLVAQGSAQQAAQVEPVEAPAQPTAEPTPAPTLADVDADDDPFLGGEDAKVVLIEFSDFRCGYCKRFYDETLPLLLEKYGDDLKFVYRDMPVVGGAQAAVAAECADEQGEFWAYHDSLFADPSGYSTQADFESLAEALNLDLEAFTACFTSDEMMEEVTNDVNAARAAGVTGTPTFFINGTRIIGARPFDDFVVAIDAALDIAGE